MNTKCVDNGVKCYQIVARNDNKSVAMHQSNYATLPRSFQVVVGSWWRHQMETSFALLALCAGDSLVIGEFPSQRPSTRNFNVFFGLCLNKRLSKQSWGLWFEARSRSWWRHCNVMYKLIWQPGQDHILQSLHLCCHSHKNKCFGTSEFSADTMRHIHCMSYNHTLPLWVQF